MKILTKGSRLVFPERNKISARAERKRVPDVARAPELLPRLCKSRGIIERVRRNAARIVHPRVSRDIVARVPITVALAQRETSLGDRASRDSWHAGVF